MYNFYWVEKNRIGTLLEQVSSVPARNSDFVKPRRLHDPIINMPLALVMSTSNVIVLQNMHTL